MSRYLGSFLNHRPCLSDWTAKIRAQASYTGCSWLLPLGAFKFLDSRPLGHHPAFPPSCLDPLNGAWSPTGPVWPRPKGNHLYLTLREMFASGYPLSSLPTPNPQDSCMAMAVPLLSWVHRNVCQDLLEDTCEGKPFLFKWGLGTHPSSIFCLMWNSKKKGEEKEEKEEREE